jgi:hypothetical protein
MVAALAGIASAFYAVPVMMGQGPHWALTEPEAQAMGKALDKCVKSLPAAKKKRALAMANQYLPWVSLATTTYMITAPRLALSAQLRTAGDNGQTTDEGSNRETVGGSVDANTPSVGGNGGAFNLADLARVR